MAWISSNRARKQQELDDEILAHFEIEVQRRIDNGETPQQAEDAARRQFGNIGLVKEVTRDMWGRYWLDALLQDLKIGTRTMRKTPGFTAAAVLTIALGVGAATAMFGVVNGILLRPLPYPHGERIAMLWRLAPVSSSFGGDEYPWGKFDFGLFRQQTRTFESVGAFQGDAFNLTGSGEPVFLEGIRASSGFFPALGLPPAIGRWFTGEEDRPGHEHVVVLSDRVWREHFGANKNILGQAIQLNGFSYTVMGVMPPGFSFPRGEDMPAMLEFPREAQLWVPLAAPYGTKGGPNEWAVIGRLRTGRTLSQAQAELDVFAHTFAEIYPEAKEWSRSRAVALKQQIVGDVSRPLVLFLCAVGLVLVIACSNVASLVFTRSLGRRREFDLRTALGAGHGRLMRQLLTENLLLASIGGLVGILLAQAALDFVKSFGPANLPRLQEIGLDPTVFAFCAGVTLLAGLGFGLLPALSSARGNLASSLRSRNAGRHFSPRFRNGLLVAQVAFALVLVIAAGLLLRTFYGLLNVDRGFRVDRVLTFEISLPPAKYPDPDHMAQLYSRALHALQSLPGIEAAGLVHAVPMGGAPDATGIRVPGHIPKPGEQLYANYMLSSPGYFSATQTPLLQGRDFSDADTLDAPHVTIVNRAMADALWPGQNAIGKTVGVGNKSFPIRVVVGVAANVKQESLREETAPQMYVPYTQNEIKIWPPMRTMQMALRTAADPGALTRSVRQAMHEVDAELPVAKVATLKTLLQQSMTQPRFAMLLLTAFGIVAMALACIGMYGVISHSVAQRTQEIGIRIALGAERSTVFAMILRQGARLAATGIVIGLVGALAGTRMLATFLYGVRPADPLTFLGVSTLLATVALLACYLPARRATRVDPVIALREE